MKKTILFSALFLAIALPAQAQEGYYAGWDLGLSGDASISGDSVSSSHPFNSDLDIASGFNFGYELKASDKINVAYEAEIYIWGNYKTFSDSANEVYVSSTAFNVKPKYYINDNIYIGGTLGYGSYTLNIDRTNNVNIKTIEENGFIYGLEGGYQHHNGVLARAGYKKTSFGEGGITLDLSSFYVGIGYKF